MSCSRREFSSSGLGLASSIVGNTSHIMSTSYNYNTNKTIILILIVIVSDIYIQFISDISVYSYQDINSYHFKRIILTLKSQQLTFLLNY